MTTSSSLDHWRGFFRAAGDSDIFHVIRQAIRVAASDHPDEFKSRRDEIAQMLFAVPKANEGRRGNAAVKTIEVKAIEDKEDDGRRGNAVKAIEVKSIEENEDGGRSNVIKAIEVKAIEEREEDSGRGNAVKSGGALFLPLTPSEEQKPERAAVAVDEEQTDTMRRETWKLLSVSKNGKIRFKRFLHDQTKPSEPQRTISREHPPEPPVIAPEPSNQEGSLPTFTEHQPEPDPVIAPSTRHSQGRSQRTSTDLQLEPSVPAVAQPAEFPRLPNMLLDDASLRSKLETSKRKLREGYQQTENAKRQRKIQVIQPREVPKDSGKRPPLFKSLGTWLR